MARATDFLGQTSGKLDEMFQTRQTDHGTILARNPKRRGITRRSEKQANTRCQLANVSANYQLFRCKKMQTFEGKEAGQNDFNIFVQVNYDRNPVFITKQDRKCGGCVLGNYQYSLGSLNPIAIDLNDGDGEKQVSTQRMKVVSDILAIYQSEAAFLTSAKSYGGINTREDYLDPVNTMADLVVASASANAGGSEMSSGGSGSGSGTQYTEALTLTDTTTVKAIAIVDGVSSSVTSRTFTKGSGGGGNDDPETE